MRTQDPDDPYARPAGLDDATVGAVGKLSEAVESAERARGRLFDFHQLMGRTDLLVGEAADALEEAGHGEHARRLRDEIIGRNVLHGRWTFQVVDEFTEVYWEPLRAVDRWVHDTLQDGRRHVQEAEMKEDRRSHGRPGHDARPAEGPPP